ncbi:Lactoylglutathione lyase [Spatholobus suberectus]|nr:Lactoylglutathione lyase [Spatholobus suberectus]
MLPVAPDGRLVVKRVLLNDFYVESFFGNFPHSWGNTSRMTGACIKESGNAKSLRALLPHHYLNFNIRLLAMLASWLDNKIQIQMYRIKDPKVSLDFYSRVLGMSLLKRLDFPEMKFSLYFMGYEDTTEAPSNPVDRTVWTFSQKATIELTHNWNTESDPEFKGYHNSNLNLVALWMNGCALACFRTKLTLEESFPMPTLVCNSLVGLVGAERWHLQIKRVSSKLNFYGIQFGFCLPSWYSGPWLFYSVFTCLLL